MPPNATSVLLLLLPLLLSNLAGGEQISDRAALQALRSAVGRGARLSWNDSDAPCSWQGVACTAGNVTTLRLPAVGLIGTVPSSILSNLTSLHTLSLHDNALSGEIPTLPPSLRNLYLHNNRLSGTLSPLIHLQNLVRLNLAGNNLSGAIPPAVSDLTRLRTLYLHGNSLSGEIPPLNLSDLQQLNLSDNSLSGSIPPSLRRWPADSFLDMSDLCGHPLPPCPGEISPHSEAPPPRDKKKKLSAGAIAGIAIGCAVGALILAMIIAFACRRRKRDRSYDERGGLPKEATEAAAAGAEAERPIRSKDTVNGNGILSPAPATVTASAAAAAATRGGGANDGLVFFGERGFELDDLLMASAEVLGNGTFGVVYKATVRSGVTVAVKRLKGVQIGEEEYADRANALGAMHHPFLVPLRAFYYSRNEKLLIYDYMPMGSLSALLHGNRGSGRSPLNWEARSSIALAAGRCIEYIHSLGPGVSHGNIKSSNILLSDVKDVRVSDQGLTQLVNLPSLPTRVAGYRAPEVTDLQRVSQKADVYSFGVLLLELLTGKAPQQALLNDEGVDLPRWVQSVVREEWTSEVFDLELLRYQNVEEEMVQLLQLAMDCAAQYPDNRPAMSQVVEQIDEICGSNSKSDDHDDTKDPTDQYLLTTHEIS